MNTICKSITALWLLINIFLMMQCMHCYIVLTLCFRVKMRIKDLVLFSPVCSSVSVSTSRTAVPHFTSLYIIKVNLLRWNLIRAVVLFIASAILLLHIGLQMAPSTQGEGAQQRPRRLIPDFIMQRQWTGGPCKRSSPVCNYQSDLN